MENTKTIPEGITIIYFNDMSKNIYAKLSVNKEQAKRLAKRIYKDAMSALSDEKSKCDLLCQALFV